MLSVVHHREAINIACFFMLVPDMKHHFPQTLGCEGRNYYEVPMERARLIGEHVEQFYENLHLRSRHFEQSQDKEVSVAVDANNDLIDLFENDKYPISTHISDFMTSTEVLGPVPAEIGALGGAPAPVGRKGRPLGVTDTPQKRPQEKNKRGSGSDSSDSDSDSSSGSDRCVICDSLQLFAKT